jgi:hypothetical protein
MFFAFNFFQYCSYLTTFVLNLSSFDFRVVLWFLMLEYPLYYQNLTLQKSF